MSAHPFDVWWEKNERKYGGPLAQNAAYAGYRFAKATGPAWHDAPTVPGLWRASSTEILKRIDEYNIAAYQNSGGVRWYGPLPEDKYRL